MADIPAHAVRRPPRSLPERILGPIAASCLFGMMALTFASVIARYFLNRPIAGDAEVQGFFLGLIIFTALPLVTRAQRHIAVHSFAALLKGRALTLQRIFVRIMTSAGFAFIAYLLFLQGETLSENNTKTNYLDVPEAPFAYFFAALAIVAALMAVEQLYHVWHDSGEPDDVIQPAASVE
jgi:TRAP-type C4-dicarboxylate transport system permease small subunit